MEPQINMALLKLKVWWAKRHWWAAQAAIASASYELRSAELYARQAERDYRLLRSQLDATLLAIKAGKEPKP